MADKTVSNSNTTGQTTQTNNTQQPVIYIPQFLYRDNVITSCYYFYSHGGNACPYCTYLGINPKYIEYLRDVLGYIP